MTPSRDAQDELAQPLDVAPAEAVDAPPPHPLPHAINRSGVALAALGAKIGRAHV